MNFPRFRQQPGRHAAGYVAGEQEQPGKPQEDLDVPEWVKRPEPAVTPAPQDETMILSKVPAGATLAVRPIPVPPFSGPSSGFPRRVPAPPVSGDADTVMAGALRGKLAEAVPEPPAPAGIETLRRVRDALLPATLLRAVPRDGSEGSSKEILSGWPEFAGLRVTETGQQVACLRVGGDGDVQVHLENAVRDWWGGLAGEALRAEFAGLDGEDLTRAWDAHIAWASQQRDARVYGDHQDSSETEEGSAA